MSDPATLAAQEAAFLAAYDPGDFERPSVATDVVVLTVSQGRLHTVLLERAEFPHKGRWMLPGGFVGLDEELEAAAARHLRAKGGLEGAVLSQLHTFGRPGRDPRMRIITVAHLALVPAHRLGPLAGTLCPVEVPWSGDDGAPAFGTLGDRRLPMAFDHAEILGKAVQRARRRLDEGPLAFALLPERFTLRALQEVHEAVLGHPVNKPSFRRRMLASGALIPTGEREADAAHRPAELYRCAVDP